MNPFIIMGMNKKEQLVYENLFYLSQTIEKIGNSRHAAAIIRKGITYSIGINSDKTDPFQRQFATDPDCDRDFCIHAEMAAIKRAVNTLRISDLSHYTLIVVRCKTTVDHMRNNKLVFGNSKPCEACQNAIDAHNIRKVIYSLDHGYKIEKTFPSFRK